MGWWDAPRTHYGTLLKMTGRSFSGLFVSQAWNSAENVPTLVAFCLVIYLTVHSLTRLRERLITGASVSVCGT